MFPAVSLLYLNLVAIVLILAVVLLAVPILVYFERKVCAWVQDRRGPNRVNFFGPGGFVGGLMEQLLGTKLFYKLPNFTGPGTFQPFADAIKLLFKEDILPEKADKLLYTLAPIFAFVPPLVMLVVIPFSAPLAVGPDEVTLRVYPAGNAGASRRPLPEEAQPVFSAWHRGTEMGWATLTFDRVKLVHVDPASREADPSKYAAVYALLGPAAGEGAASQQPPVLRLNLKPAGGPGREALEVGPVICPADPPEAARWRLENCQERKTTLLFPANATITRIRHSPRWTMQVADLNVGLLFFLAVASLGAYGIAFGGWASNNKYSLLGGIRATAQMVSYEVAMGLVLLSVLVLTGTVSTSQIAAQQTGGWLGIGHWNLWSAPGLVAFLLLWTCAFAENNRLPFDLPECDAELVGGYHTEYSSMKFGMFFMGEYVAMVAMSALLVTLFLGGGAGPWVNLDGSFASFFWSLVWFGAKMCALLFVVIWVRWTLPRFRYDQLMRLGWRVIIPAALVLLAATAVWVGWKSRAPGV